MNLIYFFFCKFEKFRKIWKFQIFRKIWKIQKKNLKNSEKKSEKFRKNLKIANFQDKSEKFRKIWKFQIFRSNVKNSAEHQHGKIRWPSMSGHRIFPYRFLHGGRLKKSNCLPTNAVFKTNIPLEGNMSFCRGMISHEGDVGIETPHKY